MHTVPEFRVFIYENISIAPFKRYSATESLSDAIHLRHIWSVWMSHFRPWPNTMRLHCISRTTRRLLQQYIAVGKKTSSLPRSQKSVSLSLSDSLMHSIAINCSSSIAVQWLSYLVTLLFFS